MSDKRTGGGGLLQTGADSNSRVQDKNHSTKVRAELFVTEEKKKEDFLC